MKRQHWIVLSLIVAVGLFLALTFNVANGKNTVQALGDEVHAGTFAEPRLITEPAWQGAVFVDTETQTKRFYIAAFDSNPFAPNPAFPDGLQSSPAWIYAGQHSGLGSDLKPFTEPTRVDALHLAQIDGKKALLRSKIDGLPTSQTPYPTEPESNDFWDFIGFFEKSGTEADMKDEQDLVWPGVFMMREPSKAVYTALRTGNPTADNWPTPDSEAGAGYWKFIGSDSGIATKFPKPWSARSVQVGSYYHQPANALRNYYWGSKFIGFPALVGGEFPAPMQTTESWAYAGRHAGSAVDPKAFGEPQGFNDVYRARIEGKWVVLHPRFEGLASAETPYPVELKTNEFWDLSTVSTHAGTWQDPQNSQDTVAHAGQIHAQEEGNAKAFYRSLAEQSSETGWDYSDTQQWQPLGLSQHAGTVADPKGQTELTWPGAVHVTNLSGQPVYFVSMVEGVPADGQWPLPTTFASNEHWTLIPYAVPMGTFEQPRRFSDYSQAGSVYVDNSIAGERRFYIAHVEGYPADDIDSFATVGIADPNWEYAGRHSGLMTDLKPFDDVTRVGAFHDAIIAGKDRAVVRSLFNGLPSADTPYPMTPASTEHWEFIGIFKHAGTADDLKGRDEMTWPGALHLDDAQQIVYSALKTGVPDAEGWAYPSGNVSDDNWEFVESIGDTGTLDAPRERNSLSTPGTVFADQHGLLRQKLYRSKFAGFAKDVGAEYPSGSDSNEFYDYLGDHAGTFADPKPFTEPTWAGAIHQTTIDGQLAFFDAKFDGRPGPETPFPETLSGNEHWDYKFTTAQAGTFVDPKNLSGITWPGAVHQHKALVEDGLYKATKRGNPDAEGWPEPGTAEGASYWSYIGPVRHKGTFADPKDFTEATGTGLIHTTIIDDTQVFFRSMVNGNPLDNDWTAPVTETGNEYWEYLGKNEPAGTWDAPKGAGDFTRPGSVHAVRIGDKRVYLISKVDGLPGEHDWPYPASGENAYWRTVGESRHSGYFADPKDQQEVTWNGAIHMRQDSGVRMYYRAQFSGNLPDIGNDHPLPPGPENGGGWEYVGSNSHAGTLNDPHSGPVLTWPGSVHQAPDEHIYYTARFTGVADATTHPFPSFGGNSNPNWTYIGYRNYPGTVLSPRDAHEITSPDAVHGFELDGKPYYVRSKFNGVPPDSGWVYPVPPGSDSRWEHVEVGIHAGNWDDPKPWSDITWPSAVHVSRHPWFIPERPNRAFFRSKFWGKPGLAHLFTNSDMWEYIGASSTAGTLEQPNSDTGIAWTGSIHRRSTGPIFQATRGGFIGTDTEPLPEVASSNGSFRYLGEHRNAGDLEHPKAWDEYTWPGRVHNNDIGRTILYFSAKMTGTPADAHNLWDYPKDESSDEHWAYIGRTVHKGTYADPHEWSDITWPGAIHRVEVGATKRYFSAAFHGSGEANNFKYPDEESDDPDGHWLYEATGVHDGNLADPILFGSEPVWPGAIVVSSDNPVNAYYYTANNDGIPADNDWPLPAGDGSNVNWVYQAISRHAGTKEDPKDYDELTWPTAYNFDTRDGVRIFFMPRQVGVPEEEDWKYPQTLENDDHWLYAGYEHINGTIETPKAWRHITDVGMIHSGSVHYQTMLFASRFSGQADPPDRPANVPEKTFPDGATNNQWWDFVRKGDGTEETPNASGDYSLIGDVNEYFNGGRRLLFRALKDGKPSSYGGWYPTSEVDNEDWTYISEHAGTFADPKEWNEWTKVGEIHRYRYGDQTLFFKAKKEGYPSRQSWGYPTTPVDNNEWTYQGSHAGTRQDPKIWNEPTWPGAIHWYREKNLYFISSFNGSASQHPYPTTPVSDAYWKLIDTGRTAENFVNDFSRPFDEYTWVTAHNAYKDDLVTQMRRGVRGLMLDIHMDGGPVAPQVRLCHWDANVCLGAPLLSDGFRQIISFLESDRNAVISVLFESTVSFDDMKNVLESVPEVANYSYNRNELLQPAEAQSDQWPTLQELIDSNKRLVMFSDRNTPGVYDIGGQRVTIFYAGGNQVENTYNLGNTAITHDWSCISRYGSLDISRRKAYGAFNRLFVLNQFHAFGSSTAHAGDMDNNLTWLQRRVERDCGEPSGWRKPNYLAIDFNQVGDAFRYAAALSQGGVYLYERNSADRDGDTVCVLPIGQGAPGSSAQYDLDLPTQGCENDEFRSLELDGVSAGTRIEFYDHPQGDRQDDFTIIDVKQSVPLGQRVRIDSLEGSEDTYWYSKAALRNNGLNGKVSRIRIRTTPAADDFSDAFVVFKEGNGGTESTVCTVPFNSKIETQLGAGNNSYGCDNDEIRSAIIFKAKKGSAIVVTGHPKGNQTQGLTAIKFKRDVLLPITINSFNHAHETDDYTIEVVGGGNLDGLISHMRVLIDGS